MPRARWFIAGNLFWIGLSYIGCWMGWQSPIAWLMSGSAPTVPTEPPPVGFFDDPRTQIVAGLTILVSIVLIALMIVRGAMQSRRVALMAVAWLIDRHDAAERRSYHAVWLERRAVRVWKRINPKDGKKTATAIRRVIQAGYGLDPAAMPKAAKKARRELPADVPDLDHWRERKAA